MTYNVRIEPSQHAFTAEEGETLLEASLRQGLLLPYGCRDGACGACKGGVLQGTVDHGKAAPHALTDADKAAGKTLFCCATAQSDLVIECREVRRATDIPVKTLPARLEVLTKPAADVAILKLKLPAAERLQFLAGQYVDVLLPGNKRRSFSIANAPHDDAFLELHVRHVPGGLFTDKVFSTMKERDILRFNGPHGTFFLREESTKPMVLVAGGTGFAPIKALVEHALHEGLTRPMAIYWGARDKAGLYLPDLPAGWAAAHPHISFVPVLSEPAAGDAWDGRTGFVHQAVLADFPDLSGHEAYVCGAPVMVEAAKRDFAAAGLPEDAFFADSFEFSADALSASPA